MVSALAVGTGFALDQSPAFLMGSALDCWQLLAVCHEAGLPRHSDLQRLAEPSTEFLWDPVDYITETQIVLNPISVYVSMAPGKSFAPVRVLGV